MFPGLFFGLITVRIFDQKFLKTKSYPLSLWQVEYGYPRNTVRFSFNETIGTPRDISANKIPLVGEKAPSSGDDMYIVYPSR